jgi:PAS domain S-box-containing protein
MATRRLRDDRLDASASVAAARNPNLISSERAQGIAFALGLVAFAIGLVALAGWLFDLPALRTVLPGLASMKANTSVGIILGGGTIALVAKRPPDGGFPVHMAVGLLVGGFAALTFVEYLTGANFGIDELLFADTITPPTAHPGRMSVATAVNFMLLGGALAFTGSRSRPAKSAFLTLGTLGLLSSLCAVVGYVYGVPLLYTPIPASSVALHTAFAFTLLFFGVAALRPDLGWVSLLVARTPGSALLRILLPTVLAAPLIFGWAVIFGTRHGLYDVALGLAVFTILGGALMAGIVWHFGRRVNRAEEALQARQRVFDTVITSALDAFVLMDEAGRIVEWNQQAERIFGWSAAEALGRPVADTIVPPDYREAHSRGLSRFLSTRETRMTGRRVELRGLRRDGSEFPLELVIAPLQVDGRLVFSGFLRDLSELRRAEEQLRQSQRLEVVGQLTGGVAHDFNNLLTVIIGSLDAALERVAPPLRATLANALKAAERGAVLVRQLLAFSRRQTLAPQPTDLNALIEEMGDVLYRTLGKRIKVELTLAEGLWLALSDRAQVETALLNLAINARDAMPAGGKLVIETANAELDEAYAAQNLEVAPGDYVMLAVTDTGTGMLPAVMQRAFEPFFTTKEVGKGTGLGLSMVYGFVKQSGGHVKIYSEVGVGTTVRMYLPRAVGEGERADETAIAPSVEARGCETILLVEDSDQVRGLVAAQLQDLGYRVIEAANGPEALGVLSDDRKIDLLFTDVVMGGGMTGKMLADEARRHRSDLRVLFTSGYTDNSIMHHGQLDKGINFLSKPYRRRDLAETLRRVLDAAP